MLETINAICQFIIPVTGISAMYLVASPDPRTRMWAGIVGLCGEPAWIFTVWLAGQWGILLLALAYCVSWARVAYVNRNLVHRAALGNSG